MTGMLVAVLLTAGCAVLLFSGRSAGPHEPSSIDGAASVNRQVAVDPHDLPLFVHQLSGLLKAGRSPHQLWRDALDVYSGRGLPMSGFAVRAVPVLQAAQQGASMGLRVPDVLRRSAAAGREGLRSRSAALDRLWRDLAACVEVAESSGAPLAVVLDRYASQLESSLDAEAARATALAGPKATTRLLTWLPVFGLGLGFLLGVQPVAVLLGSPLGLTVLFVGLALMALGRWWSHTLVAAASRPV